MKTITVQTLVSTIESILKEQEKLSQIQGQKFTGMSENNLIAELNRKFDGEWSLKRATPYKFTLQDVDAVANSRFMRATGTRILMMLAIVVLGLGTLEQFRLISYLAYLGLAGLSAFGFFWYLIKKQAENKKSFRKAVDGQE